MKKTLLVIGVLTLIACGGSKTAATVQPTVQTLAEHYSEATVDQLTSGKALFEKGCDQCHGLEKSFGVSTDRLAKVVPEMVGKANQKAGQQIIDAEGGSNILHYLLALNTK